MKLLNFLPSHDSLFETVIVAANDELVSQFLNKKIKFTDLSSKLIKFINLKEFNKYKKIHSFNINDIVKLNDYVRLKINSLSV